jgi:hypothetical protein
MVCYARRTAWISILGITILTLLGADETHLFNVAGLLISLAIVFGAALAVAVGVVVALRSVQHRRAAQGACLRCEFRCQHAMTGPQRMWLISHTDREQPQPVFVPTPRVPVRDHAGPQWPDRPVMTTAISE